jgi:hypothetical protein
VHKDSCYGAPLDQKESVVDSQIRKLLEEYFPILIKASAVEHQSTKTRTIESVIGEPELNTENLSISKSVSSGSYEFDRSFDEYHLESL